MQKDGKKVKRIVSKNQSYLEIKKELDGSNGELFKPQTLRCNNLDTQDDFYLFLNQFKNNNRLITLFIQQIATAIHFISASGRAHGHLAMDYIYFPVFKGMLKPQGQIKISGLSNCINIKNK